MTDKNLKADLVVVGGGGAGLAAAIAAAENGLQSGQPGIYSGLR